MKIKNPRLVILSAVTIVVAIFYLAIATPFSSVGGDNICQDTEYANEQYVKNTKDILALRDFARKRNDQCKSLLKAHKNETKVYKKMENCDMFQSAASASGFLINLSAQYQDYTTVKKELDDADKFMKPYTYCPQYQGVQTLFHDIRQKNEKHFKDLD